MVVKLAKYLLKFNAADVNGNRKLNAEEYAVFYESLNAEAASDGKFVDRRTGAA